MKINPFVCAGALLLISGVAMAQATPDGVADMVKQSLSASAANLVQPKVMGWLGGFLSLQFVLTNFRQLFRGADLQEVMAKWVGAVFSAGLCIAAITVGPEFIDSVGNDLLSHFLSSVPSAGAVLAATLSLCTTILAAAGIVSAVNNALASVLTTIFWIVLGGGVYLACKVFMFYLELGMIVLVSPISFALLGMDTFRDQGLAPIKSLVSLVFRAVLFGVIFGAFAYVANSTVEALKGIIWADPTSIVSNIKTLAGSLVAYPILLFLTFKSDSIAATLASGSAGLSNGDVGQAVAAGAAAGAAVAAAGSATAAGASKVPQSMAAFMDSLGGGGSISNASPMGIGGDAPVFSHPTAPALSVGATARVAGGDSATSPPSRPQTDTVSDTSMANVASGRYGVDPGEVGQKEPAGAGETQAPGGASDATIGGPPGSGSSKLEEKLEKLVDHMTQQKKPTLGERLGEANRHLSQEQSETRISMNPHPHD